jgi:23S rRNA pseudouridine1911/1915/1917 synthase
VERFVLEAPADAAGLRVDRYLAGEAERLCDGPLAGMSRSRIKQLLEAAWVTVDGLGVRSSHKLRGGETITVRVPEPEPLDLEPEAIPLDVLFEDGDLIAVAKPAGLVVHPGAGRTRGTLVNALLAHCTDLSGIGGVQRPGIVHRLDKDTSGVIIAAKNDRAHEAIAAQFSRREVVKRYVAFVLGRPRPAAATLDTGFGRHPKHRKRFTSRTRGGKRAVTSYETVASGGGVSRLDVLLGTGRTHQIRVHLSEHGHAIVADPIYGGRQWKRITDRVVREVASRLGRQALHAARLELAHPTTGVALDLVAPLPDDLVQLDDAMRAAPEA